MYSVSAFRLKSLLVFLNETDGRQRADVFIKDSLCFAMDAEVFGIQTLTCVSVCCLSPLPAIALSLVLSGLQLVC